MANDAPKVIVWEWNPVKQDSGDVLLTPNDITGSAIVSGASEIAMADPSLSPKSKT
jgi:hypothetical protein